MAIDFAHFADEPTAGARLGAGIGNTLSKLADLKLQQIEQRNQGNTNEKGLLALGFEPQQAKAYSQFDTPILQTLIKQRLQQPQQAALQGVSDVLLGGRNETPQQNTSLIPNENNNNQATIQPNPSINQPRTTTGRRSNEELARAESAINKALLSGVPVEKVKPFLDQIAAERKNNVASEKNDIKREEFEHKKAQEEEAKAIATNTPREKLFNDSVATAKKEYELAQEMINQLTYNPDILEGFGGLLSKKTGISNAATQNYEALANELATIKAKGAGGGKASEALVKLAQTFKGSKEDFRDAQVSKAKRALNEAQEWVFKDQIRSQLIEENEGRQPANLYDKIERRYQQLYGDAKRLRTFKAMHDDFGFPYPSELSPKNPGITLNGQDFDRPSEKNGWQWTPL